ncbi:MAG: hypothetical protein JRI73_05250, partial [Deltaproteobacteria bacterium]|nr:hypothetical protein [Deltaproteobacteria bacterium]
LSASLAKSRHEKELFTACFDSYFSFDGFSNPEEEHPVPSPATPEDQDSPLTQMLLSGDNTGLSISMREAAKKEKIREIYFFTQKSLYVQRILKGMGLEGMNRDMERKRAPFRKGEGFCRESIFPVCHICNRRNLRQISKGYEALQLRAEGLPSYAWYYQKNGKTYQ